MSVKSDDGEELGGVDVIRFKKKLVEEDGNKNTLTSKDILKLPQRGVVASQAQRGQVGAQLSQGFFVQEAGQKV